MNEVHTKDEKGRIMASEKHIYIHFETKPSIEQLAKYFRKYPAYRKLYASSYMFSVPYSTLAHELYDWADECFKYDEHVLCICKSIAQRGGQGLCTFGNEFPKKSSH